MWKGLLPLGSIVLLEGGNRRLMVTGQCVSKEEDESAVYDYSGVLYPEGFLDPDSMFMFNGENIERVYHVGYIDEKTMQVLPKIQETLDKLRSGSMN